VNYAVVVGRVWSGSQVPDLDGAKLLIVEELRADGQRTGRTAVAVDTVGAGAGERVFTVAGSSARMTEHTRAMPVDLAITGIIDPA
jgi:ethanolamine utilization protein EutN